MAESRAERRLRYLRSGTNSNFTITCRGREWKIHKEILSAETDFFEAMCFGNFEEANKGKVDFPDQKPEVVDQVLVYLYTGVYDDLVMLNQNEEDADTRNEDESEDEDEDEGAIGETSSGQDSTDYSSVGYSPYGDYDCTMWESAGEWPRVAALSDATEAAVTEVFTTAILTYSCAKMMGLREFQDRIVPQIMEKEFYLPRCYLGLVLETLFDATEADDEALRTELVYRCCRNHFLIAYMFPPAIAAFEKHERLAWNINWKYERVLQDAAYARSTAEEKQWDTTQALEGTRKEVARLELEKKVSGDIINIIGEWCHEIKICKCGRSLPENSDWPGQRDKAGHLYIECNCGKLHSPRAYHDHART